jgi:hypothetical protein
MTVTNTIGTVRVVRCNLNGGGSSCYKDIRRQRHQFRRESPITLGIACAEPIVHLQVVTNSPAQSV